jgi:hypothetical protein
MTNSPLSQDMPSPKQLSYLRDLANDCGETFAYPQTSAEASREIRRLKTRRKRSSSRRRGEDLQPAAEAGQPRGDAARVRSVELTGYGSTAAWSKEVGG